MATNSLSNVAEKLALSLTVLRTAVKLDKPKMVAIIVERIAELLNASSDEMERRKHEFANVGDVNETVNVGSISYDSAHRAAFREAQLLMASLWFHMNPEYDGMTPFLALLHGGCFI